MKKGYVYLLKDSYKNYKIGFSINPFKRSSRLSSSMPYDIDLVLAVETKNYKHIEKKLHDHFNNQRIKGEWFNLQDKDVDFIYDIFLDEIPLEELQQKQFKLPASFFIDSEKITIPIPDFKGIKI